MILKVILFIILYLLMGVGVLEIMLWHDRQVDDCFSEWVEDDVIQVLVVVFMPFSFLWVLGWLIYKAILAFIKCTRLFFTTLVYMLVSYFKGDKE